MNLVEIKNETNSKDDQKLVEMASNHWGTVEKNEEAERIYRLWQAKQN